MLGRAVVVVQKKILPINPLRESKKKYKKIASLENFTSKKMSTGPSLYYESYGSYGCPKNFLTIKPHKEVEKIIASLEN